MAQQNRTTGSSASLVRQSDPPSGQSDALACPTHNLSERTAQSGNQSAPTAVTSLLLFGLLGIFCSPAQAQTRPAAPDKPRPEPVAIYVDCKGIMCDDEFFRTEIPFVSHVRERHDADVHILMIGQPTGGGGSEVMLSFIGQKEFAGLDDTLYYVKSPAETEDQLRRGLANALMRGLVRYVNRTLASQDISIRYAPSALPASASVEDPWNHWSFTTSVSGFVSGEELVSSTSFGFALSANRTTDDWKIHTSIQSDYNRAAFDVGAEQSIASVQRNHAFNALIASSRSNHLSLGGRLSVLSSTFLNQSLTFRLAPAVEYNFFPYSESSRRMLTVEYSIGAGVFDYEEETIFGKQSENLLDHRVLATVRLTQPWGSLSFGAEGSHYLHDYRQNRGILAGSIDWNLGRGLSLFTFVNFQRIRDQVFLPSRGASEEEILLRQRQLATSYSYSSSVGITYRFGTRNANVVNRRFAGSVGGMNLSD